MVLNVIFFPLLPYFKKFIGNLIDFDVKKCKLVATLQVLVVESGAKIVANALPLASIGSYTN